MEFDDNTFITLYNTYLYNTYSFHTIINFIDYKN